MTKFWLFPCRRNTTHPYGDSFHLFGLKWTSSFIAFSVDDEEIGRVTPPGGGFWQLGALQGENIWKDGSKMAPFDQEVSN